MLEVKKEHEIIWILIFKKIQKTVSVHIVSLRHILLTNIFAFMDPEVRERCRVKPINRYCQYTLLALHGVNTFQSEPTAFLWAPRAQRAPRKAVD